MNSLCVYGPDESLAFFSLEPDMWHLYLQLAPKINSKLNKDF